MAEFIPKGVDWVKSHVEQVDPDNNKITLVNQTSIE